VSRAPRRAARGPSGRAPDPPARLAKMALPLDIVPAGTSLARIHRTANDPIFFGPGAGNPPTYRFDSMTGQFGVLYVGLALSGALVETLLRNPKRRMVAYREVESRASSELRCSRELRLVQLHGAGLQNLGVDNAISTGPYDLCGRWADALWAHPEAPDGIAYQSRHDPREICLAIFERPGLRFTAGVPVPLLDQLPNLTATLSEYGKSVAIPPR
jgi:hypothetical protein